MEIKLLKLMAHRWDSTIKNGLNELLLVKWYLEEATSSLSFQVVPDIYLFIHPTNIYYLPWARGSGKRMVSVSITSVSQDITSRGDRTGNWRKIRLYNWKNKEWSKMAKKSMRQIFKAFIPFHPHNSPSKLEWCSFHFDRWGLRGQSPAVGKSRGGLCSQAGGC